jgi:hypothetical protein
MPVVELASIAQAVFSYLLQQTNISGRVRSLLNREPKQLAFRRALRKAFDELESEHQQWTSALFDTSFFENEGAPILAQFMVRGGHPNPSELFLSNYCGTHECPHTGLDDLLATELSNGNCLVLFDGLDEIVDPDDRRGVVQRIEDFVRWHGNLPNHQPYCGLPKCSFRRALRSLHGVGDE